jgi:CDGSH-type Zn-finger protein
MAACRITINTNGSIRVEGDFELVDRDGGVIDIAGRTRVSLCRCGLSANKPFCDSSHKHHDFQSVILASEIRLPPPKPADAPPATPGA